MLGEKSLETCANVDSDMFDEYLSEIVTKGIKDNKKYQEIRETIRALYEKFPKVFEPFNSDQMPKLSEEEYKALTQMIMLENEIMVMELESIYSGEVL
jgi:uncharacterized membrane protein (DUF106 family)